MVNQCTVSKKENKCYWYETLPTKPQPIPHMDILKRSCLHIMRTLGAGHREAVYHTALITALNKARVFHRSETVCAISYLGETVGYGKADLIIDDIVVELKATSRSPTEASGQLKKYVESLTRTEKIPFRGVIINFNQKTATVDFWYSPRMATQPRPKNPKVVTSRFWRREVNPLLLNH